MHDTPESEGKHPKKAYQKPELVHVELRPEEAVLGHCKLAGSSGPGGVGACVSVGPCSSLGS